MPDWSIEVDLSPLEDAIQQIANPDLTPLTEAIRAAAEYVRQTWGQAVQGLVLPGMNKAVYNDDYYESLQTGESLRMIAPLHGAVVSTYAGTDRVENGYPSFDMKPGLLASLGARDGKHGRYVAVPFRHMTPEKNQVGAGQRVHGATMPPQVYRIVKQTGTFLDPASARRGAQLGQRSKLASSINIEALARGLPPPMAANYTWKFGLYHGMKKIVKQYGKTRQSTYLTWRTVSETSDPSSWIHPGMPANPVIDAVINATRDQVTRIVMDGARQSFGQA
jgi:hypothetical protein